MGKNKFRDGFRGGRGGIDYMDAFGTGIFNINIIHPYSASPDNLQRRTGIYQVLADLGCAADKQRPDFIFIDEINKGFLRDFPRDHLETFLTQGINPRLV